MSATSQRVAAVRRFNRFYTRQIGVLRKNYLDSPYSLGEMRVLYELAQTDKLGGARTASDIGRALDLDAGYLSRVLRNFEKRGLITRKTSTEDARQSHLALDRARRQTVCAVREALAGAGRRHAAQAVGRRTGAPGGGHDDDRGPARRRCRAQARIHFARAALRRSRLDRHPPRPALRAGIRLDRTVRRPVRADRRRLRQQFRPEARTLLDRRDERRECRLRPAGQGQTRRRAAAPAAGRSQGARPGARAAAGGRMRAASRARPATRRSRCGPTASSPPPATLTRRPASRSPPARRNAAGARTWWRNIGIWTCSAISLSARSARPHCARPSAGGCP